MRRPHRIPPPKRLLKGLQRGRLQINETDGTRRLVRVAYAGHNDQPYRSVGRWLVEQGELKLEQASWPAIRQWAARNPQRVNELLWSNPRYVFFREEPLPDPQLGPKGAQAVPLTPGRSVAVDRLLHTFGTPFYIDAPTLTAFDQKPFRRLMIAQDTGSAITGPARGDLFAGSGDAAGEIAGVVRNAADFYALVPRGLFDGARR